jgi:hypothetical protein
VRTGCIACGFGMNFEQKSAIKCNTLSRFELLYKCYPNIYKKYVYEYKMYKPLADAGIELRIDDLRYERYFKKRKKMIEE